MTEEESDESLVAKAAQGDTAAFGRLVFRHRRRLMALSARIAGPAGAEDIVQETLARAWTHAPDWKYRPGSQNRPGYAAWLSRVAMNLALDQARRRSFLPLESAADQRDPQPGPEALVAREERRVRLRDAIEKLPERQRRALSLTYDAELSNADAAAVMETSTGAFELLLVRARRALRLALAGEIEP